MRLRSGLRWLFLIAALLLWEALSVAPALAIASPGLRGRDVDVDAEGNSFVIATQTTSSTSYCVLRKYSPLGRRLWSRQVAPRCDASAIDIAADGTLVLAGTVSTAAGTNLWLGKYSATGAKIWARTANPGLNDRAEDAVAAPDGSIYLTGSCQSVANGYDIWTAKYSSSGVRRWIRTYATTSIYGTNYWDAGYGVAVAPDGGVYVTGFAGVSPMLWLRRYSPTGGVRWTETFVSGLYSGGSGIAVGPDRSVYVAGFSGTANSDMMLVKYQPTGVLVWSRSHDGAAGSNDSYQRVAVARDGTVYVTGMTTVNVLTQTDIVAAAYSRGGSRKWQATFNGPADSFDRGYGVAAAPDGTGVFTGCVAGTAGYALWLKRIQSME